MDTLSFAFEGALVFPKHQFAWSIILWYYVNKSLSHPTTSRLKDHIWLDALRRYTPAEPKQWLTEMWLWRECNARRQDTKTEQHHPSRFITSAVDRHWSKSGWNHSLLVEKVRGDMLIQYFSMLSRRDNITESLLSINICSLFLSLFACRHFAEFTVFGRGQKDKQGSLLSLSLGRTQAQVQAWCLVSLIYRVRLFERPARKCSEVPRSICNTHRPGKDKYHCLGFSSFTSFE